MRVNVTVVVVSYMCRRWGKIHEDHAPGPNQICRTAWRQILNKLGVCARLTCQSSHSGTGKRIEHDATRPGVVKEKTSYRAVGHLCVIRVNVVVVLILSFSYVRRKRRVCQ